MELSALIDQARAVGLQMIVAGDRLRIKGPKRHEALARELLGRRVEVLAALDPAEAKRRKDHERHNHHGPPVELRRTPHGNWECGICRDPFEERAVADLNGTKPPQTDGYASGEDVPMARHNLEPLDPELRKWLSKVQYRSEAPNSER